MKSSLGTDLNVLNVKSMPLQGRHLIEASAGTGKTFNITRIYLRLIIEKRLPVDQILVMTFTNAATEELRGRLSETLREAQQYWQSDSFRAEHSDPVFAYLYAENDPDDALKLINQALLGMDESAVFTLHGFCNRVLKQLAFETGGALSVELNQDLLPLTEQAIQDWFRANRYDNQKMNSLAENGWHTPESFYAAFGHLIRNALSVERLDNATIERDIAATAEILTERYRRELQLLLDRLLEQQATIFSDLIDSHKQAEQRRAEWQVLVNWLENPVVDDIPLEVGGFLNGNRYRTKPDSQRLLKPIADLRKKINETRDKQLNQFQRRAQMIASFDVVDEAVDWIRARIASEKQRKGEWGFDDLILRVADTVANSTALAKALLSQFPVALIDEFQDTDQSQYRILFNVYKSPTDTDHEASPSSLLLMIGDPKQAIYGFRGGDIYTYLRARNDADFVWVMDTNWRSTEQMVKAYNRLFWGAPLADTGKPVFGSQIGYEQINSTPNAAAAKKPMYDPLDSKRKALTVVLSELTEAQLQGNKSDTQQVYQAQICHWMVAEIQRLLAQTRLGERATEPSDIAILVRDKNEAAVIQSCLQDVGLNSVYLSDQTRLFDAIEAHELLRVLHGVWHYHSDSDLIKALSSSFTGFPIDQLQYMQSDPMHPSWGDARQTAKQLRQYWLSNGSLALIIYMLRHHYQPRENNERVLTNVLHIAEALQKHSQRSQHPLQVLQWLREQIATPSGEEAFQQRLESDATLIKIVTQHKSKGLEYPFVFVPFANEYSDPTKHGNAFKTVYEYFEPKCQQRLCQLGPSEYALDLVRQQAHEESVRLLYVAMTRPEYRCYMGVGAHLQTSESSLGRVLQVTTDAPDWSTTLQLIAQEPDSECCVVSAQCEIPAEEVKAVNLDAPALKAKTLTVSLQSDWRIHSFSGLIRSSTHTDLLNREHERFLPASEVLLAPHHPQTDDERVQVGIRFSFPKGALPGNFLHDALEHADFQNPDWSSVCEAANHQYDLLHSSEQLAQTQSWLSDVIETPLIAHSSEDQSTFKLSQLTSIQVAKEAEFYFPLAAASVADLQAALVSHRQHLHHKGLLSFYADDSLSSLSNQELQGMMHGFIDLTVQHNGRFYIIDYKSTHLGEHWDDYLPETLCRNNTEHHYDLQYLIYSLALHRRLKNVIPDYQVSQHFGGVIYLYLRGMHPLNTRQQGVFYTPIDEQLMNRLDAAVSGQNVRGVEA